QRRGAGHAHRWPAHLRELPGDVSRRRQAAARGRHLRPLRRRAHPAQRRLGGDRPQPPARVQRQDPPGARLLRAEQVAGPAHRGDREHGPDLRPHLRGGAPELTMSIQLKSPAEIAKLREANLIVNDVLDTLEAAAKPGMTTWELNDIADKRMKQLKGQSAFLGYHGYPAVLCTSVNEV